MSLQDDVLDILIRHEKADYKKTGTEDYPLNSLYQDLTHSSRACHFAQNQWNFVSPNGFGNKPIDGLHKMLTEIGFEVFDDGSQKRSITRVRLA